MTTDELRDELARELGWQYTDTTPLGYKLRFKAWIRTSYPEPDCVIVRHPIPDTLDAIAEIWDRELKGWGWLKKDSGDEGEVYWHAQSWGHEITPILSTGNEKHDRLALMLAAVREAKR